MAKEFKRYCVRVVRTMDQEDDVGDILLEQLRYAGLVMVHDVDPNGLTKHCYDILPPQKCTDTKNWAERNAARMQTFGFNAVAAPVAEEN